LRCKSPEMSGYKLADNLPRHGDRHDQRRSHICDLAA
jgi:hypothetical protein